MAQPAPAESVGLPQFDVAQWPGQMVWMLVIFAVMYFLFSRVFVPRVGNTIAEREDKIAGDIGEARRLRDEARAQADRAHEEIGQARARAQRVAAEAAAQAKAELDKARAEEDARLADQIAASEARISESRTAAMSHVRGIAVDTAQAIIAKLTGENASADELARALPAQAA